MHAKADFVLHGGQEAFMSRQKALFDHLSMAEKQYNKDKKLTENAVDLRMDVEVCSSGSKDHTRKRKRETRKFCGKESIFKQPEGPAPRSLVRSIPDYHKNPHKWTKYSLEDVSNEDMTDQSNAKAAFSFLKELRARKKRERESTHYEMDIDEPETNESLDENVTFKSKKIKSSSKIQFRKPEAEASGSSPIVIDPNDKPVFRSSKVIMPEYVVGQKQKRSKKERPAVKVDRLKELRLEHLHESDNEEENES